MPEEETSPERQLAGKIDNLIHEVLSDWRESENNGGIKFPEPVTYPSGTVVSGIDNNSIAAGAFENAFNEGEINFLVSTANFSNNGSVTETKSAKPNKDANGYVVYTIFPPNFDSECQRLGLSPKEVVQKSMINALWKDAQNSAKELPRAQSNVKGKVGILERK